MGTTPPSSLEKENLRTETVTCALFTSPSPAALSVEFDKMKKMGLPTMFINYFGDMEEVCLLSVSMETEYLIFLIYLLCDRQQQFQ